MPLQDLAAAGTFDRLLTDCQPSSESRFIYGPPFFADDNREPSISDDGNIIAFISTRLGAGNTDRNPELFFYNVSGYYIHAGTDDDYAGRRSGSWINLSK